MSGILNCSCPVGTAIPTITPSVCPLNIGQIQKLIFWRQGNSIASVATAQLEATWTALLAAADDTRAQVSPFIETAIIAAGDPITEGGGDNTTLNGIEVNTGVNPAIFTGMIKNEDQAIIDVLKQYQCESLAVLFINDSGELIHDITDTPAVKGFNISSLFIGDLDNQGFGTRDGNAIRFSMKANWSDGLAFLTPAFDMLAMAN